MIQALNSIGAIALEEEKAKTRSSFSLLALEDKTDFDTFFRVYYKWILKIAESN